MHLKSQKSTTKIHSSPDEKITSLSVDEIAPQILFKKSRSKINNSSTRLTSDLLHTKSADLQDMLLKLSQSSDFHLIKSEDIQMAYTPNLPSIYKAETEEREAFVKKMRNLSSGNMRGVRKLSYFQMIWPFRYELLVCFLSYFGLLAYSLLKGGKGFDRYIIFITILILYIENSNS